jgi:Flp pilus assembly protein TadD
MSKVAQEAQVLLNAGELKQAMSVVNAGLNKDPDDMAALMMASCIVSRESCWGMSYNLLKHVAENSPPFPEIYNNLGMAASSLASSTGKDKYLDEAEMYLHKADRKNSSGAVKANLALVKLHKLDLVNAERCAKEALELDPNNLGARETLGYVYLHQGKWVEGFGNYQLGTIGGKYRKQPQGRPWEKGMRHEDALVISDGKTEGATITLEGKLLVRGEQGIGDEISYASVLIDAARDHKIIYECDSRLEGLMRRSLPVEVHGTRFSGSRVDPEDVGAAALTGSLFMQYRRKDEDFPRKGFLKPDPERQAQWRVLLDQLPGKKVGIAWTGGLDNTFKHRRSFDLEHLLPILKTPGISWVSLQYNDPSADIASFKAKHGIGIKHWARAVEKGVDYDETAALVSELDLVISTTTAMVHLCGALGKKCLVLVPKRNRWFYSSDDSTHRWYDSLELFKQADKWPVERVAQRLKELTQ